MTAGGGAQHVWSRRTNGAPPDTPPLFPLPSFAVSDVVRSELELARGLPVRLRDPRRLLAIALLAVAFGIVAAFLVARGQLAGSDALAYWTGVRHWFGGED